MTKRATPPNYCTQAFWLSAINNELIMNMLNIYDT